MAKEYSRAKSKKNHGTHGPKGGTRVSEAQSESLGSSVKPLSVVEFSQRFLSGRHTGPFLAKFDEVPFHLGDSGADSTAPQIAPRIRYLSECIKKSVTEFLCRHGGYRKLLVITGRKRTEGRLWDPKIWSRLEFKLSSACLQMLLFAYRTGGRQNWTRRFTVIPETSLGDEIFATQVLQNLCLDETDWLKIFKAKTDKDGKVARLPFARFLRPDLGVLSESDIQHLQQDNWAYLQVYLARYIAREWYQAEKRRRKLKPARAQSRYQQFGDFLERWLNFSQQRQRSDLLFPLIEYFMLVFENEASANQVVSQLEKRVRRTIPSASKQQEYLRAVGTIYKLGERLTAIYQEAVGLAFIERSAADQVYMATYYKRFAQIANHVKFIGRHLSGEVG